MVFHVVRHQLHREPEPSYHLRLFHAVTIELSFPVMGAGTPTAVCTFCAVSLKKQQQILQAKCNHEMGDTLRVGRTAQKSNHDPVRRSGLDSGPRNMAPFLALSAYLDEAFNIL